MQVTYKICTENKNKETILAECNSVFKCFTCYESIGYWNGEEELALTIETTLEDTAHNAVLVLALARSIKLLNNQEAVLVTCTKLENATFV